VISKLKTIWEIKELRDRILFTFFIILIYRIGAHIPIPGINTRELANYFMSKSNTLFDLYNMFAGGAFKKATIFALGIMPYISASIIMQLLGVIYEPIKRLQNEGMEGRKQIIQYTRYGTIFLSSLQALGISIFLTSIKDFNIILINRVFFTIVAVVVLTTGTVILMWFGERITEKGIGNGISLLIFLGIISRLPAAVIQEIKKWTVGATSTLGIFGVLVFIVLTTAAVVYLTLGTRKIPIQTTKRIIGNKIMGGQTTYLPIRVNSVGVIAIIFASSFLFVPNTIASFFPNVEPIQVLASYFRPGNWVYTIIYTFLIIIFMYLYTAIQFNPYDIAENLRKQGAFIPGYRAGKWTAEYLDKVLTRLTLPASIFIALVAIIPDYISYKMNWGFYLGGTTLLIVVGVALDVAQQIEGHLLMHQYDGLMGSTRIRGRRSSFYY